MQQLLEQKEKRAKTSKALIDATIAALQPCLVAVPTHDELDAMVAGYEKCVRLARDLREQLVPRG